MCEQNPIVSTLCTQPTQKRNYLGDKEWLTVIRIT